MSYEIVYTSAPRGLNDSDRGFCTVAATDGIPRVLREKLESLSGYRHAFASGSRNNPVNYCHQVIRIRRESFYVLSRIADAGVDYSGRNNKIAHHLALSAADVRTAGCLPTELFADRSFWFTEWDDDPKSLPAGRLPSVRQSAGHGPCRSWKTTFGDAGWAGVLARAIDGDMDAVSVIVPPGCNTLALVSEALQLVPPRKRWKVGFSTYFTRSTGGSEIHWRFLVDGTEEAAAVRERQSANVIDARQTGVPSADAFVNAARTGDLSKLHGATSRGERTREAESEGFANRPVTRSQIRRRQAGARARRARLAAQAEEYYDDDFDVPSVPPPEPPKQSATWIWWAVAAGILAASFLSFVIVWSVT